MKTLIRNIDQSKYLTFFNFMKTINKKNQKYQSEEVFIFYNFMETLIRFTHLKQVFIFYNVIKELIRNTHHSKYLFLLQFY